MCLNINIGIKTYTPSGLNSLDNITLNQSHSKPKQHSKYTITSATSLSRNICFGLNLYLIFRVLFVYLCGLTGTGELPLQIMVQKWPDDSEMQDGGKCFWQWSKFIISFDVYNSTKNYSEWTDRISHLQLFPACCFQLVLVSMRWHRYPWWFSLNWKIIIKKELNPKMFWALLSLST